MKKITLKVTVLCFALVAMTLIFASCTSSDGNMEYKKVKGGYEVVSLDKNAGEEIEIPSTYNGNDVISIADNAFYGAKIKKITIPSTIKTVGNQAFAYCERLEGVYITDINAYVQIEFASVESNPLYYARKLYINGKEEAEISIDAQNIGSFALSGLTNVSKITLKNTASIGGGAFSYASGIVEIILPDTLKSIGASAFSHASSLASIAIPNSATEISHSVFASCASLKSATLPSSLMAVPERMFLDCISLETVALPDSLLTVSDSAFSGCSTLDNITIPAKVTEILNYAFFNCANLKTLNFAESSKLMTIGSSAFRGCYSIVDLSLMNASELTLIDESAFQFCTNLTNIQVPNSVKTLGDHAFSGCTSLALSEYNGIGYIGNDENTKLIAVKATDSTMTSAKITSSTKFICSGAFERHQAITEITIVTEVTSGEGILNIGCNAFAFCPKLTKISIGKSIKAIGDNALMGCKALKVIKYGSNSSSWKSVTKGTNWTYGAGTSTVTYS